MGLVTAWLCAVAAAFVVPRIADRNGNHRVLAAGTLAVSGLDIAAFAGSPPATALVALCFAAAEFIDVQPLFWTFPANFLGGLPPRKVLRSSIGALGGFVAPNVESWADVSFGSPQAGLYVLACTTFLGAALIFALRRCTNSVPAAIRS